MGAVVDATGVSVVFPPGPDPDDATTAIVVPRTKKCEEGILPAAFGRMGQRTPAEAFPRMEMPPVEMQRLPLPFLGLPDAVAKSK